MKTAGRLIPSALLAEAGLATVATGMEEATATEAVMEEDTVTVVVMEEDTVTVVVMEEDMVTVAMADGGNGFGKWRFYNCPDAVHE